MHQRQLRLSKEAEEDLQDIALFSSDRWGTDQSERYIGKLVATMNMLCRHPDAGHDSPGYGDGTFEFTSSKHVIVFRYSETELHVVTVVHARSNRSAWRDVRDS